MTKQRSIIGVIDEMLAVIPADQTEFIAQLDILVQAIQAVPQSNTAVGEKVWAWHWDRLGDICEQYIGIPNEPWHFQLASVVFKKPVGVIMQAHQRYQKENQ